MSVKCVVGSNIVRFDVVDSTNEKAKELLDEGVIEGTVVVAGKQVSGKGRHGRAWFSPLGGLYMSIIIKPSERSVPILSLLSGLPVVWTLREFGVEAALKWPNDVLVVGRKISGILCEGVFRRDQYFVVVGIGVNTGIGLPRFPDELRETATSLRILKGKEIDNEMFLRSLIAGYGRFYERYGQGDLAGLLSEYKTFCGTLGKRVLIETAKGKIEGEAHDITEAGAMIVVKDGRRIEVFEGTVLSGR